MEFKRINFGTQNINAEDQSINAESCDDGVPWKIGFLTSSHIATIGLNPCHQLH